MNNKQMVADAALAGLRTLWIHMPSRRRHIRAAAILIKAGDNPRATIKAFGLDADLARETAYWASVEMKFSEHGM